MTDDQRALRDASELVERSIRKSSRKPNLTKRMSRIANRPGLTERTSDVILYAIEKWRKNSEGYALKILLEEEARQGGNQNTESIFK